MNIGKLIQLDQQSIEFTNQLKSIHHVLTIQSNQIQKNLSKITTARYHSNHPNIPLDTKLKYLPVDNSGTLTQSPLYFFDEQNMPISDQLKILRVPTESDRFQISNDKHQLTIVDKNKVPISDPITLKQFSPEWIEFEYITDDQQSVQIISSDTNQPLTLHIKSISSSKLSISK